MASPRVFGIVFGLIGLLSLGYIADKYRNRCDGAIISLPDNSLIKAEIAQTPTARARGLAGRDSLSADRGMLFLFPTTGIYPFWMKDTRLALDIIWLKDNQIVETVTLSPAVGETIPQHTPSSPADAVLEINAGQASRHGLTNQSLVHWRLCSKA